MKRRTAVYSASRVVAPPPAAQPVAARERPRIAWRRRVVPSLAVALVALLATVWALQPRPLSEKDVEALVKHTLDAAPPPPSAAQAYEKIIPSVVAVRAMAGNGEEGRNAMEGDKADWQRGTGVIIVDSGLILTNLHVVQGAGRIQVTFFDGTDSEATMVGERPEHDLAVLQAKTLPDDMMPATMRSTAGLKPGDDVVAVGFPFGIGPSASAGVISGLKRDYVSPEGKRLLTNLIQFDAAVNPGNSGGPLVTLDGEVIGIVTGLLNPTENRVFIGIGFAVPIENAASSIGLSPF
ncbi:MAG TPA: trypsin-like peptidase domain-containing protein [Burkholderiales bacterium]|nr:trypsin-like peptidase domain-containing protein [Burkholderiales bacterium]